MIYLGSDHAGFELKEAVKQRLHKLSIGYVDLTPDFLEGDDYPDVAKILAEKLYDENCLALAFCGSGQGICMALNRFHWVRAATATNPEIAKLSRLHNHANVLCLAGRFLNLDEAMNLIDQFLNTSVDNSQRHLRRVEKLDNLS
jgi:ribose 5-phosphate isomerase B